MPSTFVWNAPGYTYLISPAGPIGRDLELRARSLEWKVRSTAPIGDAATYAVARTLPYRNPPRPPGALRASIYRSAITRDKKGLSVTVGSTAPHALFVHEGTKAHSIRSRGPWNLMFYWKRKNAVVPTREVRHPQTTGQPFLTKWLPEAVR